MTSYSTPPLQNGDAENERLRFALQAAGIGTWDINLHTQLAWWDQRTQELYGIIGSHTRSITQPQDLLSYVHPGDQLALEQAMQWALNPQSGGKYAIEFRIHRRDNGQLRWLQAIGQAYFDEQSQPIRLSGTAQDITQAVMERQLTQQVQEDLQRAIELAQLGTWQYDLTTGQIDYSPRLRNWHGIEADQLITPEQAFRFVHPADWPRVRASMQAATAPGSDGHYEVEYRIRLGPQEAERIFYSLGKSYFTPQGQAYKISGMVQEVTQQRRGQLALEQQVIQRTQQLESSLTELRRSNERLQQFAYVASHDLQEPLRKIQQFGDLLMKKYGSQLGTDSSYLSRMQVAGARMSRLIKDLLAYSRIGTQPQLAHAVCLNSLLEGLIQDFELPIQETGTQLTVDDLPTVSGDEAQLNLLFRNLLSNALKFHLTPAVGEQVVHQVRVLAARILAEDLPAGVHPVQAAFAYHRIDVADNGIGFDVKYLDRIFTVFQRLHSPKEYAGTGIGLAICQQVVTNHGGWITAQSQPGKGATFSVYLPE
ncbi:sensor histidine kinase [Spirosoma gilvum]